MMISKNIMSRYGIDKECYEFNIWFNRNIENDINILDLYHKLEKENNQSWILLLILKLMNSVQLIQLALFSAEQVVELYNKKFPQSDYANKTIKLIHEWINEQTTYNMLRLNQEPDDINFEPYTIINYAACAVYYVKNSVSCYTYAKNAIYKTCIIKDNAEKSIINKGLEIIKNNNIISPENVCPIFYEDNNNNNDSNLNKFYKMQNICGIAGNEMLNLVLKKYPLA